MNKMFRRQARNERRKVRLLRHRENLQRYRERFAVPHEELVERVLRSIGLGRFVRRDGD